MKRGGLALSGLVLTAGLLTSCAESVSDAYVVENDPGRVEHVDGSDIGRVILEESAVERLGVRTEPVTRSGSHLAVPDSAVLVDPDGHWWVFTSPRAGTYVRHEITLLSQRHGRSLYTSGPPAGTSVVTVGVPELYGVEAEVGH